MDCDRWEDVAISYDDTEKYSHLDKVLVDKGWDERGSLKKY